MTTQPDPCGASCEPAEDATAKARSQAVAHPANCECRRDRSAGRWCETCQEHGSHHSDRHVQFHTQDRCDECGSAPRAIAHRQWCPRYGQSAPWRVGRKVGRTVYDSNDVLIGVMDTPELAARVVDAVNRENVPPLPPELCGVKEAIEILGVTRQRIHQLRQEGTMPDPVVVLAATPVWNRADVERLRLTRSECLTVQQPCD